MMNDKLHKLLSLCLKLNEFPGIDAFFEFSGHVNCAGFRILKDANYSAQIDKNEQLYNSPLLGINDLDQAIQDIKGIIKKVKNNE